MPYLASESFGSDHRVFSHAVQFYLDDSFLFHMITRLMISAFNAGDGAIVIATAAHHEVLRERVMRANFDIEVERNKGTYVAVDVSEVVARCTKHGTLQVPMLAQLLTATLGEVTEATGKPLSRTFVFGELVALLCAQGNFEDLFAFEQVGEHLRREYPVSILCGYAIRLFQRKGMEKFFRQVCEAHPTVISPDAYPTSESERRMLRAIAPQVFKDKPDN